MTISEQAAVIWPLLRMAAKKKQVITYGEIRDYSGIPPIGQGKALHLIYLYCGRKSYPELNSLAVNKTRFPGWNYPGPKKSESEFLLERERVFAFGWTAKNNPRSGDLQRQR